MVGISLILVHWLLIGMVSHLSYYGGQLTDSCLGAKNVGEPVDYGSIPTFLTRMTVVFTRVRAAVVGMPTNVFIKIHRCYRGFIKGFSTEGSPVLVGLGKWCWIVLAGG